MKIEFSLIQTGCVIPCSGWGQRAQIVSNVGILILLLTRRTYRYKASHWNGGSLTLP